MGMRAGELAMEFATVGLDDDALEAARILAAAGRPALIVLGDDGLPYTVLPGSQVLRFVLPQYVQDDPRLARVYDEQSADALGRGLSGRRVRDVLREKPDVDDIPVVEADATAIEVAAVMARMHSPIVAVVGDGRFLGAITVSRLFGRLLPTGEAPQGSQK